MARVASRAEEIALRKCNNLIQDFGRRKAWAEALAVLWQMRRDGPVPSLITANCAISACGHGHRWTEALNILGQLPDFGLRPDVFTFGSLISACEKARQWQVALALLKNLGDRGLEPDLVVFNATISALEKGAPWMQRQWSCALNLLESLCQAKSQPGGSTQSPPLTKSRTLPDVVSFNAAISAC
ncbi:unnamed protein product, partial [Polarella glacialis]